MMKRLLICLMTLVIAMSMLTCVSFADDGCTINVSQSVTGIEVTKGGREQVDLSHIFSDSEGHDLTYTVDAEEESLKARIKDGMLLLDPLKLGEYEITLTAQCAKSGTEEQLTIPVNVVEAEDEGNPMQYGYDETPADEVSVYCTISSDGVPLLGNDADNTVLAHLKVTVPYFDLSLYGLEAFYRYHTANGRGDYIDDEVVERPTAMHMLIYMTERYYMGLPEEECCKGTSGVLSYNTPTTMRNMYGDKAYDGTLKAYGLSGTATSTYMENFWGHNPNLMYYRNHFFPLMSPGWGSTSDYQLLSEGNTFDLAMYSDADFFQGGFFACFDKDEYETVTGEKVGFVTQSVSSSAYGSGTLRPVTGFSIDFYDHEWNKIGTAESDTPAFSYVFNEPGTYYALTDYPEAGTSSANRSPATAIINVNDAFEDLSIKNITDQDGNVLSDFDITDDLGMTEHYHLRIPSSTATVKVEWEDLLPFEYKLAYFDYSTGNTEYTQEALEKDGNTITIDPARWHLDDKALVICDSEGHFYGAFTFEVHDEDGFDLAPMLKYEIREKEKKTVREQKEFKLDLGTIFYDPEGEEMTFAVSIDGGDETSCEQAFVYDTGSPATHTLAFTATDSEGNRGATYTLTLVVKNNLTPELSDQDNVSSSKQIRTDETAELELTELFTDYNNDELSYLISIDGGEYEPFEPETYQQWWTDLNGNQFTKMHYYFRYRVSEGEGIGTEHTYGFKTSDGLSVSSDEYTYNVRVVENQPPVPKETEITASCMRNHYWYLNPQTFFSDPEGDKILSYTVSVNGGPQTGCEREWHHGGFNYHRVLISGDEPYTVKFYAADRYGDVGTCTATIYPTEEIIRDANLSDNVFSAGNGTSTFKASTNVTLRDVKYSEFDGDYNYYLDIDDYNVSEGDKVTLTRRGEKTVESGYGNSYNGAIYLDLTNGSTTAGAAQVTGGNRYIINMVESGDAEPEELVLEPEYDSLYAGELADRVVVKARFSDGVTRYINDYTLSDDKFDSLGKHTLTASALGLTASKEITVNSVPDNIAVINDMGKYGRIAFAEVVDQNNEPVHDALITVSDPVMDPDYDDSKYDGSGYGGIPDMLRKTYDVEVRVPMSYDRDQVRVRFRMYKELDQASEYMMGDGKHGSADIYLDGDLVENEEHLMLTDSYKIIELADGKGTGEAWWIDRDWGMRSWWHSYDLFDVSVKTGVCEIVGKVSSWDDKSNSEFLAYPESLSDKEIRSDVMGERSKILPTSSTVEEAVKTDSRYEQSFTVEGLDAGSYKLAIVKPGKYTVKVTKIEVDGTADLGTLDMRLFGDVNNDGKIKAGDATQIARFVVGSRDFTAEEQAAADVTLDGKVKIGDAAQIARYTVGKSSAFDDIK